jgi:multiple antibiotic resistance protein
VVDLANAFVLLFVTLGPKKLIPGFFVVTHEADRRTIRVLALKSTIVATAIALFTALIATGLLAKWHVSMDSVAIAGSIVLLMTSIKTLTVFKLVDLPAAGMAEREKAAAGGPHARAPLTGMRWLGQPVLSPVAIPMIITPVGVVVILFFAGQAVGDYALQLQLTGMLLAIMATNFVAMIVAGPIMRAIGLPIMVIFGWVISAVQAGLAVEIFIAALRRLHVVP